MKVDVFISYSHEDRGTALALADFLKRQGFRCWIDREGLRLADGFEKKITEAIRNCRVVLWLASNHSLESDYVRYEVAAALGQNKAIGPVFLEPLDSAKLRSPFDFAETRVHGIEYYKGSVEDNLATLLEDLRPLVRPGLMRNIAIATILLLLTVGIAAAVIFKRTAEVQREQWAELPAGDVLKVAYTGAPLAAASRKAPLKLQFGIAARRYGEDKYEALNDGDALVSELDTYVILARPLSSGHLYLFQIDSSGRVEWLYPRNESSPFSSGENPVDAGEKVQVPPASSGRDLYLDSTTGIEHIYAVFAAARLPALESALAQHSHSVAGQGRPIVVIRPNELRTRGVGGTRLQPVTFGEMEAEMVDRVSADTSYTFPFQSPVIEASSPSLVVERWFRHNKPQ